MEGSARPGRRHRAGALAAVMAGVPGGVRVLLCTEPTDMRKSFDGLIAATKAVIGEISVQTPTPIESTLQNAPIRIGAG